MKVMTEPFPLVLVGPSLSLKPFCFSFLAGKLRQIVHLEGEVHQVGLHLHLGPGTGGIWQSSISSSLFGVAMKASCAPRGEVCRRVTFSPSACS